MSMSFGWHHFLVSNFSIRFSILFHPFRFHNRQYYKSSIQLRNIFFYGIWICILLRIFLHHSRHKWRMNPLSYQKKSEFKVFVSQKKLDTSLGRNTRIKFVTKLKCIGPLNLDHYCIDWRVELSPKIRPLVGGWFSNPEGFLLFFFREGVEIPWIVTQSLSLNDII